MLSRHWNKKKLTALVCASLMTGMLFPCAWAEAAVVEETYDDGVARIKPPTPFVAGKISPDKKLRWVSKTEIALDDDATHLIIDFTDASTFADTNTYEIYAGCDYNGSDPVTGYELTLKNGEAKYLYGGYSKNSNAERNIITISGGSVNADINGGYSNQKDATENTVTISGGVNAFVYGG